MATVKDIEIGGRKISVRQLTVEQVTNLMDGGDAGGSVTTAELLIPSPLPLEAVVASSGLSVGELNGDLLQDELAAVYAAVEEVNPFLSGMLTRLAEVAARMQPSKSDG